MGTSDGLGTVSWSLFSFGPERQQHLPGRELPEGAGWGEGVDAGREKRGEKKTGKGCAHQEALSKTSPLTFQLLSRDVVTS